MTSSSAPPRVVLAVETSGEVGSVALGRGPDVLARAFLEERGAYADAIVPAVAAVMDEAGFDRDEIEGVAVGAGPGSFTGVRVAAATAKGIARALDVPLWPLSSLAAAALGDAALPPTDVLWPGPGDLEFPSAAVPDGPRYVLFDARDTRVYAACYDVARGRLEELVPPHATDLERVLASAVPDGAWFVGTGAVRHREAIGGAGHGVLGPPAGVPSADGLVHLLHRTTPAPVEDRGAWEPDYLRASGAERERAS